MKWRILFLLFIPILFSSEIFAQRVAVKTNLLYDATLTLNGGFEVRLSDKWTTDVSGNLNAWDLSSSKKWKHWLLQPEARYWFCESFGGHFLGFHALGGQYNVAELNDSRYQGWFGGGGVAYGYAFMLNRHLNLELELGLGYIFFKYDKFECLDCGRKVKKDEPKHFVGPTKAALNLVYTF